jgi:NADPH-dependent glutamate synthase beta subunit-like oxidoreductase
MAADPVLKARWLAKHCQSRVVELAARKGGADVMIHLLRMGAVSATEMKQRRKRKEKEKLRRQQNTP